MTLIEQFQVVLIFMLIAIGMIVVPLVALRVLRPSKPSTSKATPYECGMDPIGDAQVCFDMRFYTDALIFLVFEVETLFLFPWARVFRQEGWTAIALFEGLVFVGILFLGLIYVWAKGDIDWVKSTAGNRDVRRDPGVPPTMPRAPGAVTTGPAARDPQSPAAPVAAGMGDS